MCQDLKQRSHEERHDHRHDDDATLVTIEAVTMR